MAQCNGGSLTGVFGPQAHEKVHMLLANTMVAFMGSDAHNLRHRNTDLSGAKEKLVKHWDETTLQEIVETRPRYILENKPMPDELYLSRLPETVTVKSKKGNGKEKKKGFFARLFG